MKNHHVDIIYRDLVSDVLKHGELRPNRTGTDTLAVFGRQVRFDLRQGFPLLTTKKVHTRSIIHELLWFLAGNTNVKDLQKHGVTIWDEWQFPDGSIGRGYGAQWREWKSVSGPGTNKVTVITDQISDLVKGLRENPFGRRHIVTAWNPGEVGQMALPPCHIFFQCHVHPAKEGGKLGLSLQMYQRSCDLGLGIPFNIASYAILLAMLAQVTDMEARDFIHDFGDLHIYVNHIDQLVHQGTLEAYPMPRLTLNPGLTELSDFTYEDIVVKDYKSHPAIKMEVAV